MSVNESMEFEAINAKTSERKFVAETQGVCKEEMHRIKKAKAKKKAIVEKAFFGPIDPQVPASILQLHPDVTVIFSEN